MPVGADFVRVFTTNRVYSIDVSQAEVAVHHTTSHVFIIL